MRSHLPAPTRVVRQALALLATALFFLAGWAFIGQQQTLLWQRLPASAVDRFVADRVAAPLPSPLPAAALQPLCANAPSWLATLWGARQRTEIANCLNGPAPLEGAQAEASAQAAGAYRAQLAAQIKAAQAWLAEHDAQAAAQRSALAAQLAQIQQHPAGALPALAQATAPVVAWVGAQPSTAVREAVGRAQPADAMAALLRQRIASTEALLKREPAAGDRTRHARNLGLAAAGLMVVVDYGQLPAAAHLTTDKGTLADVLEWQRRSQAVAARGFSLERLQGVGSMLFLSALLLVGVAALTGGPVLLWAGATQLVGFGALMLIDLALTGDASLRYFAERQFLSLGSGSRWLPLDLWLPATLAGAPLVLWWPMVGVAAALVALRLARQGQGLLFAPVRAWVQGGAGPLAGAAQALLLAVLGAVAVVAAGMPAAVSEWLIALACLATATYAARQAAFANTGAGLQWPGLVVVAGTFLAAVGLSLQRGDLGHALVALAMGGCFLWLFGNGLLRWAVVAVVVAGLGLLITGLLGGDDGGPVVAHLVQWLPPHAQDRVNALFDPFHANSSDLARTRWLMASAGATGWGPGYVPWQGLVAARVHDGLPLQGPSDYVTALVVAQWGHLGGLALMGAVLVVFGASGFVAARTTLRPGMPLAWRLLAGVGLFGCVVMAGKVLLSAGGVLGLLPLTGLPVALLGYGPVSLLAGLLYLALALGTARVPAVMSQGVHVHAHRIDRGAVRRRSQGLATAGGVGLALLLGGGLLRLADDEDSAPKRHESRPRLTLAQDVAQAIVAAGVGGELAQPEAAGAAPKGQAAGFSCPQVHAAAAAWNERLKAVPDTTGAGPLRLDAAALLASRAVASARECKALARDLGQMLGGDWRRIVGPAEAPGAVAKATGLLVTHRAKGPTAEPRDYTTGNAWWGVPGCTRPLASAPGAALPADAAAACAAAGGAGALDESSWTDPWLQQALLPRLQAAVRVPQGERRVNQRAVPTGPVVGETLDPALQATAQRIADCYTARRTGADCEGVLPMDAGWRQRHFAPGSLRAGSLAVVLTEVDTGRVAAMAGAVSDCSAAALQRGAQPDADGRMRALRDGQPCAQLPDVRSRFLLTQHPALWMVGPGSSLKPLAALAGVETGQITPAQDVRWKSILAESHEQTPVQAVALGAGERYLQLLGAAGFVPTPDELLWGGSAGQPAAAATLGVRWRAATRAGHEQLRATALPFATMQVMRREKEAGVNVDKLHGQTQVTEYLAARRLADSSVGGADLRISAMGLVDVWRRFDLAQRGAADAAATHLLERPGQAVPRAPLALGSAAGAARVVGMTTGITSTQWKGTAQGSCRVVFGSCPATGLLDLAGKTGTADFLTAEDSPYVKDGLQIPAKLFGGVFSAQGKRWAVAVMALRNRDARGTSLDLQSSAAAEAGLTLVREMRRP